MMLSKAVQTTECHMLEFYSIIRRTPSPQVTPPFIALDPYNIKLIPTEIYTPSPSPSNPNGYIITRILRITSDSTHYATVG